MKKQKWKKKDIWQRLAKLNDKFKEIKKPKKDTKKMSETIIKN